MNKWIKHAFVAVLCISAFSAPASAGKLKVVASIPSLADITARVGGDHVDVSSITRGVQDAHYVEAKPSYMRNLSKADLLVYSGLELEIGWLPLLIEGCRNPKVAVGSKGNLNASAAIPQDKILEKPRGEVDRTMGDVHPMGNPHYMLDPNSGIYTAELIAQKLCDLDPEHAADYQVNLEKFKNELEQKIAAWEKQLAPLKGMEVVTYHPHWTYLLNWLGMETAGYIELRPGIPPTPKHKKEIEDMVKSRGIKMVIVSSWKEPQKAQAVADASGAALVVLPGEVEGMEGADDYFEWFDFMAEELLKALNKGGMEG